MRPDRNFCPGAAAVAATASRGDHRGLLQHSSFCRFFFFMSLVLAVTCVVGSVAMFPEVLPPAGCG